MTVPGARETLAKNWNKDIAPGQTLWIGFTGANTGADPKPASFSVNGARCA